MHVDEQILKSVRFVSFLSLFEATLGDTTCQVF